MQELGFNYRLSELHAALGTAQMKRLQPLREQRRALALNITTPCSTAARSSTASSLMQRGMRACSAHHLYIVALRLEGFWHAATLLHACAPTSKAFRHKSTTFPSTTIPTTANRAYARSLLLLKTASVTPSKPSRCRFLPTCKRAMSGEGRYRLGEIYEQCAST